MILHPQWIVGFTDGEGCFSVSINKNLEMKNGYQVLPEFVIVQHKKDAQILHALKKYFKCGVCRQNHGNRDCYRVRSVSHLSEIIIPFFMKHSLKTKKKLDFIKFRKIILLMVQKQHLTVSGLEQIEQILNTMNNRSKNNEI